MADKVNIVVTITKDKNGFRTWKSQAIPIGKVRQIGYIDNTNAWKPKTDLQDNIGKVFTEKQ
jgi:hypothetical protein